jgi:hypothetical protein
VTLKNKPTATFIGFQEDIHGNKIPLFNIGKDTWSAATLARKGIAIPKIPQDTGLAGQCPRVQREGNNG